MDIVLRCAVAAAYRQPGRARISLQFSPLELTMNEIEIESAAPSGEAKRATPGNSIDLVAPLLHNDSAHPPTLRAPKNICGMDGEGTPIAAGRSGMLGRLDSDSQNADAPEERVGEARIRIAEAGRNRAGTSPGAAARHRTSTPSATRARKETVGD